LFVRQRVLSRDATTDNAAAPKHQHIDQLRGYILKFIRKAQSQPSWCQKQNSSFPEMIALSNNRGGYILSFSCM